MSRPAIKDIAYKCGVSPSTVCRALNGKSDINPKTRSLILDTCSAMGYVPNGAATRLRGQKSNLLSCIMHEGDNELLVEKIHYLRRFARESGFEWQLCPFRTQNERSELIRAMISTGVAGIITDAGIDNASLHLLKTNNIPIVAFDSDCESVDSVFLDRAAGIFAGMEYLIRGGSNRIVLLGANSKGIRMQAYIKAYSKATLRIDKNLIITTPFGHDLFQYGYEQTLNLLEKLPFDAIFAVNDACAIGAIRALKEKMVKIPEEVAIIGFDDIMVSKFFSPSLTTVQQPVKEMAKVTIELMKQRIEKPNATINKSLHLTKLILRESTY
ncbi:MAG: LacI family DNA-binding transcriptional regulator [Verrucomicrobiota bacterium]|nr:LacI family DNA-binding transcriptional regulator [Verrucomicrobiota bacterium]